MARWMGNLGPRRAYSEAVKLDPVKKFNLSKRNFKRNPFRYLIYVSVTIRNLWMVILRLILLVID